MLILGMRRCVVDAGEGIDSVVRWVIYGRRRRRRRRRRCWSLGALMENSFRELIFPIFKHYSNF